MEEYLPLNEPCGFWTAQPREGKVLISLWDSKNDNGDNGNQSQAGFYLIFIGNHGNQVTNSK